MRICHVITRMIIGGAQENTLLSCRGLARRGHEVTLCTGPTTGPEGKLLETADTQGFRIVEISNLVRSLSPFHDPAAYRDLRRFFRGQRFDVVHTHSSKAGILGRLAASSEGVPGVFHTVHGQAFHAYQSNWRNRFYIWAERLAARRSTHICAVAQAMIDQCVRAGVADREKYSVLYSGMQLGPFLSAERDVSLRESLGIPADAPVVGKIARLFELKGHDVLLNATPALVAANPAVRILLVGDGLRHAELAEKARELGVAENVVFAGLVPPKAVPRYVAQMDVLAHFSLREGLPRTVVQALAGGVPAAAFDLDGTPEVVHDGKTGLLCPPGDQEASTAALLRLLQNPAERRRLGERGRSLVRQQFDWRIMVDKLERLYQEKVAMQDFSRGESSDVITQTNAGDKPGPTGVSPAKNRGLATRD